MVGVFAILLLTYPPVKRIQCLSRRCPTYIIFIRWLSHTLVGMTHATDGVPVPRRFRPAGMSVVGRIALAAFLCVIIGVGPAGAQGTEADVYVASAIIAYEDKRYEEALSHLKQALDIEPENLDALYYTGLVLIAQQKTDEAIQYLAQARAKAPDDLTILFQLGVAYFILQDYDNAEPLLTRVFQERPQTDNLGYYIGFMRYRQKDYRGAIEAFKTGASTDPNIQQLARFYTGLALGILGMPGQAVRELEEAQRIRTVSPLIDPLERLRDTLVARRERERRLRAQVRLGAFYDTNVAVNPLSSADTQVIALRRRDANSPGELASLNVDYSWLRRGPWESTVGYTFFQTINNDLKDFNIQNHMGSLAGFYRGVVAAMPFQLGVRYSYDLVTLHNNKFLTRHSASVSATVVENSTNLTSVVARLQNKDFDKDFLLNIPEENRDANNWMVGFTHILRFAEDKHLFRIGYQYDQDDAKGRDWFYRGHRALAGAQYTLPWGDTRLIYNFDFHYRKYPHPNAVLPQSAPNTVKQKVREQNHVVRVEKPLPYNLTLAADFQLTRSRSDLDAIFNFNRELGTLSLTWVY